MSAIGRDYTKGKTKEELIGQIGFSSPVRVDVSLKRRVLVTGAGSYIGESFRRYAAENYKDNFEIDAVDMLLPSWKETDFSQYDIVYHVAGIAHADVGKVSEETKEKYYRVNTDLAVEVCEKAKDEGVKEFVFMSSMIVYGDSAPYGRKKVVDERTAPNPANFYGDSKLQADVAVRGLAGDGFKVVVLRPPMIYGKGSKGNYQALAKLARRLPIFPDVGNERSMLYIGNLCEFLCQLMLIEPKDDAVVLIPQNAEWTRTSEMVRLIAECFGRRIRITKALNPLVWIASWIPGRIRGLVNKAFGSSTYSMKVSVFDDINYQTTSLRESVRGTEGE